MVKPFASRQEKSLSRSTWYSFHVFPKTAISSSYTLTLSWQHRTWSMICCAKSGAHFRPMGKHLYLYLYLYFIFVKRCDDYTHLLGFFIGLKGIVLHWVIKFCNILVSLDWGHNIMDNKLHVLFSYDTFVERVEIRDLFDSVIFFVDNKARQGPLWGTSFFKNSNINNALELLFWMFVCMCRVLDMQNSGMVPS